MFFFVKKGKIFIYLFKRPRYMCIVNYSSGNWCLGFVYVALTPPPVERRRAHRPPRLRQKWFFDDAPFRRLCWPLGLTPRSIWFGLFYKSRANQSWWQFIWFKWSSCHTKFHILTQLINLLWVITRKIPNLIPRKVDDQQNISHYDSIVRITSYTGIWLDPFKYMYSGKNKKKSGHLCKFIKIWRHWNFCCFSPSLDYLEMGESSIY